MSHDSTTAVPTTAGLQPPRTIARGAFVVGICTLGRHPDVFPTQLPLPDTGDRHWMLKVWQFDGIQLEIPIEMEMTSHTYTLGGFSSAMVDLFSDEQPAVYWSAHPNRVLLRLLAREMMRGVIDPLVHFRLTEQIRWHDLCESIHRPSVLTWAERERFSPAEAANWLNLPVKDQNRDALLAQACHTLTTRCGYR